MKKMLATAILLGTIGIAQAQQINRIAFGSCISQDNPQQIWYNVDSLRPDVFVFLGDNIYGDTKDMALLRKKYEMLQSKPGLQQLKQHSKILAVWDDHDYGVNDGGKEYPKKVESKEIFLEFFNEPKDSERRKHPGIYHSVTLGEQGKRVQFILLDNRTFRDSLCKVTTDEDCYGEYGPCKDTTKTMLGKEQWEWLEKTLKEPADIRIICTSTQFLVDFNGWEAWANMPHERKRMIDLIKKTKANGVFFISGDLHYAELSRMMFNTQYPLYDLTSSGMTHGHSCAGENEYRIHGAYMQPNFGLIDIDWKGKDTKITLRILNEKADTKITHVIPLQEISFK
ncbi:MAG: alkaline phosphatase D family protein [Chitinophagales bacterium]|nr:alkaline phosphatase D family protein [Chitinophagales bacterium]